MLSHEAKSWFQLLLKERFGVDLQVSEQSGAISLVLPDQSGSILFDHYCEDLYSTGASPDCGRWFAEDEGWSVPCENFLPVPGIEGDVKDLIEKKGRSYLIHYDFPGLVYWTLNRLEEIDSDKLDEHGRFSAKVSHAFRYGYLYRPIIDEWFVVLGQVIKALWPELELKKHEYSVFISHDVDRPSLYSYLSLYQLLRGSLRLAIKERNIREAFLSIWIWLFSNTKFHKKDLYNTFSWIMSESEKYGLKSAFFFLSGNTNSRYDASYSISSSPIKNLMREIHDRGHEIGLHPSYESTFIPGQILYEAERLRSICNEIDIRQSSFGGRMHYLRWRQPQTMRQWEEAGLSYDSTLGYADSIGFRCGTCFEYTAFDPCKQSIVNLRLRPLIVMEASVLSKAAMGLNESDEAFYEIQNMVRACKAVNGTFSLLWHNSSLATCKSKGLYQRVLSVL